MLVDRYNRTIDYLRVSVTDRCNLSCKYCIGDPIPFIPHSDILSYEEIARFVEVVARLGVKKVRITGGEPLVRKGLPFLIRAIADNREIEDLGLTTNGVFLGRQLAELKEAGLKRVNVSLDSLRRDRYQYITGVDALNDVLQSIKQAFAAGLLPIKINTVVIKGFNDDEVLDFVRFAKEFDYQVRFIELMPFGKSESQSPLEFVSSKTIKSKIQEVHRLVPSANLDRGPARIYEIDGGAGKVGFISPVSTHLCSSCNRLRLTSNGKMRLCLFSGVEYDVKSLLRGDATDKDIEDFIREVIKQKPEGKGQADQITSCPRTLRNIGG